MRRRPARSAPPRLVEGGAAAAALRRSPWGRAWCGRFNKKIIKLFPSSARNEHLHNTEQPCSARNPLAAPLADELSPIHPLPLSRFTNL